MAIEGVMKLFLMIAVIIVGMSFLMKAFGIDIFEWLQEKFGGFGVPESGKAIHVKMKVGSSEHDVHAFHLVSREGIKKHWTDADTNLIGCGAPNYYTAYFMIETDPTRNILIQNNCIILADDEMPDIDESQVYYISPGTLIQNGNCQFLSECLQNKITSRGCSPRQIITGGDPTNPRCGVRDGDSDVECHDTYGIVNLARCATTPYRHDYPACDEERNPRGLVINNFMFGDDVKISDRCFDEARDRNACNLLAYKEIPRRAFYGSRVKYGLVCGGDGVWYTCTPKKADIAPPPEHSQVPGLTDCRCERDPGGEFFVWRGTCQPPSGGGGGG
ncbi:MAG: hypothetical protein QXP82_03030 [Candidatus Aenigmatarchaeota archaeon]